VGGEEGVVHPKGPCRAVVRCSPEGTVLGRAVYPEGTESSAEGLRLPEGTVSDGTVSVVSTEGRYQPVGSLSDGTLMHVVLPRELVTRRDHARVFSTRRDSPPEGATLVSSSRRDYCSWTSV
jgi:hypothetical protein